MMKKAPVIIAVVHLPLLISRYRSRKYIAGHYVPSVDVERKKWNRPEEGNEEGLEECIEECKAECFA